MKRPAAEVIPELQRIRHYIMDIIYHSEGRKVKLPSLRTLSEEFGLGISTIKLEFDKMEKEGYVSSRHGVGVFTNPTGYFFPGSDALPLIGIKFNRGDAYYYDTTLMKMIAELMTALANYPCNVHMLTAGCTTVAEFAVELQHSHIDALITVSVEPELVDYAAKRMPTVNIGYPCPSVGSVVFRAGAAGRELAELLCREASRPGILQLNDRRNIAGFSDALQNDSRLNFARREMSQPEEIEQLLKSDHFDCVITHSKSLNFMKELVGEKVHLLAIDDGFYPTSPACFSLGMPRREAAGLAAARLTETITKGYGEPFEKFFEHKLLEHKQISSQSPK